MIRDRDSLTDTQVTDYEQRSQKRLMFLPYYHIENAFLLPEAIAEVASTILLSKAPSKEQIEEKMLALAKSQINHVTSLYVKSEVYFQAATFDITPNITLNVDTKMEDLISALEKARNERIEDYRSKFSDALVKSRVEYWKTTLENSVKTSWTPEARKYFLGKRLIKEIQSFLFGSKNVSLWEHVLIGNGSGCKLAKKELEEILAKV